MNVYTFAHALTKTLPVQRPLEAFFRTMVREMEDVGYVNEFWHAADGHSSAECIEAGIGGSLWLDGKIGSKGIAVQLVLHFGMVDNAIDSLDLRLHAIPMVFDDSEAALEPATLIMPFGVDFNLPNRRTPAFLHRLASQGVHAKLTKYQPGQFREWLEATLMEPAGLRLAA